MRVFRVLFLGLLLAACNLTVPEVTPTVAPTPTPSATPFMTATHTETAIPTFTVTPSATPTPSHTLTPSATSTGTNTSTGTPSPTPTASATATATFTPTPSDTATPTDTATDTPTATFTPTPTNTLTPSATPTGTFSPTPTPSDTATPTHTTTATFTPTPSDTATPTDTATSTPTATFTPTPTNTLTPSATPTGTFSPTPTPSATATATFTPTPSDTSTASATFTSTPTEALPSPLPPIPTRTPTYTITPSPTVTQTPAPTHTPTNTITPSPAPQVVPPTIQNVPPSLEPLGFHTPTPITPTVHVPPTLMTIPPTIITAAPGTIPALVTPLVQQTTPIPATAVPLQPTNTPLPPEPTIAPIPQNVPANPQTRAFALSTNNGTVQGGGFPLPFAAETFARNPVDPSRMAVVDSRGLLYMLYNNLGTQNAVRMHVSPFFDFEPSSAADNQTRVTQVAWSPDGRYLAFLVDSEVDDRDGVWVTDNPDQSGIRFAAQVFRECPPAMSTTCTVNRGGEPTNYNSLHFEWNSRSDAILIDLWLPDENRRAFTIVHPDSEPTKKTNTYRYDYASWSQDGTRVLVSGAGSDGRVALRWIDPATSSEQIIFDGSAVGLWLQDAVERPDGQIVALGSLNGQNSAQSLYNSSGQPLTPPIGTGAPVRVSWSPDRSAVLVVVNDGGTLHYYVAEVSGRVREITASVAGALAVEWIGADNSPLPPSNDQPVPPTSAPQPISPGVQSSYGITTNQQVRVTASNGVNLHSAAGLNSPVIGLLNYYEYVVIIGGPVQADGLTWWRVQRGNNQIGWAAEGANNIQLLTP